MELLRRPYPFQVISGQEFALNWLMSGIVGKSSETQGSDGIVEPPLDIQENQNHFVVHLSIPGVSLKDISVSVDHRRLDLKIEAVEEDGSDEMKYLVRESNFGFIYRSVTLPETVELESSRASYLNGVLTVSFDKLETAKPRLIEVKASE